MLEATPLFLFVAILTAITTYIWGRLDERDKWIKINRGMKNIIKPPRATPKELPTHKHDIEIIHQHLFEFQNQAINPTVYRPKNTVLRIQFDELTIDLKENGTWEWQDPNNN